MDMVYSLYNKMSNSIVFSINDYIIEVGIDLIWSFCYVNMNIPWLNRESLPLFEKAVQHYGSNVSWCP